MGAFLSPCRLVPVTCRVIYGTASYRQGQKLSNAFINFPQDKKKKNVLPDSNSTQTPQSTSTRDYSSVKKKKKKAFFHFLLPLVPDGRDIQKSLVGWDFEHLWGQGLVTLWWLLERKTIPRGGNWTVSKTCSSSCAPEQILGRNELAFQGTDSVMQGPCAPAGTWYRELCRDTGLAWGQVQCTALLVWVTDRYPISSEIFIYCAKCAERASFPANTLFTFSCSCTHMNIWVDLGWVWFKLLHKTHTQYISPDRWSWFKEMTKHNTTHSETTPRILHNVLKKQMSLRNAFILVDITCSLCASLCLFSVSGPIKMSFCFTFV